MSQGSQPAVSSTQIDQISSSIDRILGGGGGVWGLQVKIQITFTDSDFQSWIMVRLGEVIED